MEPDSLGGIHLSEVKSLSCSNVGSADISGWYGHIQE